jgi:hypothetical protein
MKKTKHNPQEQKDQQHQQQKNQQQKSRQQQAQQAAAPKIKGTDHEQEHPETRMTR